MGSLWHVDVSCMKGSKVPTRRLCHRLGARVTLPRDRSVECHVIDRSISQYRENAINTSDVVPMQRRDIFVATTVSWFVQCWESGALGFTKDLSKARRKTGVSPEQYLDLDISKSIFGDEQGENEVSTLRYYDVVPGTKSSERVQPGDTVSVHFDCLFRNIDAVSTRSARLLGENRVIAEPYEFVAGTRLDGPSPLRAVGDSAGGLFSGQSGPKPPQALSYAVVGMYVGGKRSVFVPARLGYGAKGEQEIPPNCDQFELVIELLSVSPGGITTN